MKIMIAYVLIFAFPLLALYSSLYYNSNRLAQKDGGTQLLVALQNISDTMDEVFRSINFVQAQMQGNPIIYQAAFSMRTIDGRTSYENYQLKEKIGSALYQYYISNYYIYSLSLYTPYGDALFSNRAGKTRHTVMKPDDILIESVAGSGQQTDGSWLIQPEGDNQWLFSSFQTPFFSNNPSMRMHSRTDVSRDVLLSKIHEYYPDTDFEFIILNGNGDKYHVTMNSLPMPIQVPLVSDSGWITFSDKSINYVMAYYYSAYTGWQYAAVAPVGSFNSSISLINEYLYYFIFTLLMVFAVCMLFLIGFIIKPMRRISQTMRVAEKGDLSVRINIGRKDELGYIGHRFNILLESIEHLICENYESRLLKQEYELKFMQTQLKEHFIYNTLDSIHWIANKNHIPQISEIIFSLSRFFRLSLNQGRDTIRIEQAAQILKDYIFLYSMRTDYPINFHIAVESELKERMSVKYLFQPVLENAIIHGVLPKHGGTIHIRFDAVGYGRLRYTVEDDGAGIPPERLTDIHTGIRSGKSEGQHFALLNLNQQLQLYYGQDYRFEIDSIYGQGSRVVIECPLAKETEQ